MKSADSFAPLIRKLAQRRPVGVASTLIRVTFDVIAWSVAIAIAALVRLEGTLRPGVAGVVILVPVVATVQFIVGYSVGLYRRRWRYGSFDEIAALVTSAMITTVILASLNSLWSSTRPIPQSAVVIGGIIGLCSTTGVRYAWRVLLAQSQRPTERTSARALVFGAGDGGQQLLGSLLRNPNSPYLPVGILDDNPFVQRLSIMGVPVLGDRTSIAEARGRTRAEVLLIAIPTADADTIRDLVTLAELNDLKVKILPPVYELYDREIVAEDIRDIAPEDLLRRQQVKTDLAQVSEYIEGKRVLVTGAGGSIGSELCRQLIRFKPAEMIMLDRDESALHSVELSIHGRALLDTPLTVLCDIRDQSAVDEIFRERRPHVVFHAAALKHLPLLEKHPREAYKTNVFGTLNVLNAAVAFGVNVFVNISTDKAANPTSVLGYSKRVAERLTADFGERFPNCTFISVRFGNVLGSRGSVLETFKEQIEKGGPVTVTDKEVTRFFMTIGESVQLVVQAGAIGLSGECLVLDMGTPVRIHDVAQQLIQRSGRKIAIEFTGLRPGEKMHEELLSDYEFGERPKHPLITHVAVSSLSPDALLEQPDDPRDFMSRLVLP